MPVHFLNQKLIFPPVEFAEPDGLLAIYGDLSIQRLLLAYSKGIFPWYSRGFPILWWSPPERAILKPEEVHVSRSLRKTIQSQQFEVRYDSRFEEVIRACATAPRRGNPGTWIVPEMQEAYIRLFYVGFAHSVETYFEGKLVGGLYGVSLGGAFFGESMFSSMTDASKVAFVHLAEKLKGFDFDLIDCQIQNPHLESLGARVVPRREFLKHLQHALEKETRRGKWL